MKLRFELEEIFNEVILRLSYIAAKRAVGASDYSRHAACKADTAQLISLATEALAWIGRKSGNISFYFSEDNGHVCIVVGIINQAPERLGELVNPIRYLLINKIVYLWLLHSGLDEAAKWGMQIEAYMSALSEDFRIFGPLKTRSVSPL